MNIQECCNQNCNQGRDCPLRKKTPTDEEIENIYWSLDSTGYDGSFSFIDFARAILRKAQEKLALAFMNPTAECSFNGSLLWMNLLNQC